MTPNNQWTNQLKAVLGQNGGISTGLGVGNDHAAPMANRIPIPRNVTTAVSVRDRERIGSWAASKVDGNTTADVWRKHMFYGCWISGLVRYIPFPQIQRNLMVSKAVLDTLTWDSEVHIFDEDCDSLGTPVQDPDVEAETLFHPTKSILDSLFTMVAAAKLTWHGTKHHIGAEVDAKVRGRKRYGMLGKVVEALGIEEFKLSEAPGYTIVHELVHPPATIGLLKMLADAVHAEDMGWDGGADLVTTHDICRYNSNGPGQPPRWNSVPTIKITFARDILLRVREGGAGTRRLVDCVAAIKKVMEGHIYVRFPQRPVVPVVTEMYLSIRERPFIFGENAAFLCRNKDTTRATKAIVPLVTGADAMVGPLASYISILHPSSTLARAAVFRGDPSDKEGYNGDWHTLCLQYQAEQVNVLTLGNDVLRAILKNTGMGTAIPPTANELTAMRQLNTISLDHRAICKVIRRETGEGDQELSIDDDDAGIPPQPNIGGEFVAERQDTYRPPQQAHFLGDHGRGGHDQHGRGGYASFGRGGGGAGYEDVGRGSGYFGGGGVERGAHGSGGGNDDRQFDDAASQ